MPHVQEHQAQSEDLGKTRLRPLTESVRPIDLRHKVLPRGIYEQLFTASVVNPHNAELLGRVLGVVNIHDQECKNSPHLHLIWIDRQELRKGILYQEPTLPKIWDLKKHIGKLMLAREIARTLEGWHPPKLPAMVDEKLPAIYRSYRRLYEPSILLREYWALQLNTTYQAMLSGPQMTPRSRDVIQSALQNELYKLGANSSQVKDVEQQLDKSIQHHEMLYERWEANYQFCEKQMHIIIGR